MAQFGTFISFCALFGVAFAQQLQVLYSPESIVLQNTSQKLQSSDYSKFVALCLAYSSNKPANFDGFYGYMGFANIPLSVITLHVPFSLETTSSQTFELDNNANIEDQYDTISNAMLSKYEDSFAEKIDLFKDKNDSIKDQLDSLDQYIDQLDQLKSKNVLPKRLTLWFNFVSPAKMDKLAIQNFQDRMQKISKSIRILLDDKVVILSVADPVQYILKRNTRDVGEAPSKDETDKYNLAYAFDADYHVAFTTIGFTTILLLLTVFGVSVAMWNIDPGRDSIIYRLTSQKMKKDQ